MVLDSDKLLDQNSAFEGDIQDRAASGETRQFPMDLSAACTMATRKRAAARAA